MGIRVLAARREQPCRSHLRSCLLWSQDLAMKVIQDHTGGLVWGLGYKKYLRIGFVTSSMTEFQSLIQDWGSAFATNAEIQALALLYYEYSKPT